MPNIAKVTVEIALDREFDYLIPDSLVSSIRIGSRVLAPFGKRFTRGYVVGLADHSEIKNLKVISSLIGTKPLINENMLRLAHWISGYYVAAFEQAIRSVLPCAVRRSKAKFREQRIVVPDPELSAKVSIDDLRRRSPKQAALLELLLRKGWMSMSDLLSEADLNSGFKNSERVGPDCQSGRENVGTRLSRPTWSSIKSLEKKGLVKISRQAQNRDPLAGQVILPTQPLNLYPEQNAALELVKKSIDTLSPPVVLLHGVTGSGKTEVYLQAIRHVIDQGKGAIVLVPEISLTPQTVERFCGRFGDTVAVLHSHLSDGERHDEWYRIYDGKARIVVGARSALFAPVKRLGLIVVDEEHEPSYKQGEVPRYNARDVVIKRGEIEHCPVLLGSASPALESVYNARGGKYALATLRNRVDHRQMPRMNIVDMRLEAEREGRVNVFSRQLVEAVRARIEQAEQTILFLNRRGFSTSVICPACGFVAACSQCSVALTYHREGEELRCHICGRTEKVLEKCSQCGGMALKFSGIGTQRIESIVRALFPRARVQRMDSDTTTAKHSHRNILGEFKTGKIDILIGTQMIAKGLDFPGVTLVGVIYADHSLHMPDFRAAERTFQLLIQVAGRAGRGDIPGEVIVQTFTPFHPAVQAARRLDYQGFCDQEIESRRELMYPPFAHLVCITLEGVPEEIVKLTAQAMVAKLKALLKIPEPVSILQHKNGRDETRSSAASALLKDRVVEGHASSCPRENFNIASSVLMAGPMPAPISLAKGRYRYQIIIRSPLVEDISARIKQALRELKCPPTVRIAVDVDALSMM